jgi:hypothetical protein
MSTAATPRLPAEFGDLEPFADWALQGEHARYEKRLATSMDELQAFYDAALARIEAVCEYLDQFPVDALDTQQKNLLWVYCSLVNVSFPVEVWRQQHVPDSGASDIYPVVEPAV